MTTKSELLQNRAFWSGDRDIPVFIASETSKDEEIYGNQASWIGRRLLGRVPRISESSSQLDFRHSLAGALLFIS